MGEQLLQQYFKLVFTVSLAQALSRALLNSVYLCIFIELGIQQKSDESNLLLRGKSMFLYLIWYVI